jgi:allantoin racemase
MSPAFAQDRSPTTFVRCCNAGANGVAGYAGAPDNNMSLIRLINPNTSEQTTAMMTAIAREALLPGFHVAGVTASRGVPMILDELQLMSAAAGVIEMGTADAADLSGVIVSAFGDPGLEKLRCKLRVPVTGICEASMLEASSGGRRFGIATVTPGLVDVLARKADALGVGDLFTGTRLAVGDPLALMAEPPALEQALAQAVEQSLDDDQAEAVIIGGGPLGRAAIGLADRFSIPLIAPIPAAVRLILQELQVRARAH